jgi:hypothetical protein
MNSSVFISHYNAMGPDAREINNTLKVLAP